MAIVRGVSPISIYRGDAYVYQYQLEDLDEETQVRTPIDITNFDITGQVRYTAQSSTVWYTLPIQKTDPTNGIFEWYLSKSDSEGLLPAGSTSQSTGVYDIQLIVNRGHATDERVLTFLTGAFSVTRDVTRDPATPFSSRARKY